MQKKILIGSIIAVVVIVLASFSSVVAKVSVDEELVEFEVEFSGIGKKHTVKLTQQEADEVELLFDDIEQRLSKVENRNEAEVIFKDAVFELDKYGLLGGLSVRQAQRIVLDKSNSPRNKIFDDDLYNKFCLVGAYSKSSLDFGILQIIGMLLIILEQSLEMPWALLTIPFVYYVFYKLFRILNVVWLAEETILFSCGLNGIKFEKIPPHELSLYGFTGIKILLKCFEDGHPLGDALYLGHCIVIDESLNFPFPPP